MRRFLTPRAPAAVILAVAILAGIALASTERPDRHPASAVGDSAASPSEVAYTTVAAARVDSASAAPDSLPGTKAGEVLITRTWTNVRKGRSTAAEVQAVLLPSDTVVADSLERGWYRVALEGDVLGYVHRSGLTRPQ